MFPHSGVGELFYEETDCQYSQLGRILHQGHLSCPVVLVGTGNMQISQTECMPIICSKGSGLDLSYRSKIIDLHLK